MPQLREVLGSLGRRRVANDAGWVLFGQIAAFAGRMVGLRLLTELISPGTYAEVVLLIGFTTLGGNTFCSPLTEAAIRFYPEASREDRVGALRALLRSMLLPRTLIAAFIVVGGGLLWGRAHGEEANRLAVFAAALLLALDVSRTFEHGILNAARRHRTFAWWQTVDAWGRAAGAAIVLKWWGESAFGALMGYAVAAGLTNSIFHRSRVSTGVAESSSNDEAWRGSFRVRILQFSTPLAAVAFLGWVMSLSDRYLIASMISEHEAGIYSAAYGLASQPFIMASNVLNLTMRPIFNEAIARRDVRYERTIFLAWLALSVVVLAIGLFLINLLAEPIVRIALGQDYWNASQLVPIISMAYVLQGVQQVFSMLLYAQQRTTALMAILLTSCLCAVLMFWILIPRLGAAGAGFGVCAAMLVSLVATIAVTGAIPRLLHGRSLGPQI